MLLKDKTALVFAATGAIGSEVARQFAGEGARVFISGRDGDALSRLGKELDARWQLVDALDESQIATYVDHIARETGKVDVVFNAVGLRAADYAMPAVAIDFEKFMLPLQVIAGSQFLTARAAARHMTPKGCGAIVMLSASLNG